MQVFATLEYASSRSALTARIPMPPPLGAAVCGAAPFTVLLTKILLIHSALTKLDLAAVDVAHMCASAHTLAHALPSWPVRVAPEPVRAGAAYLRVAASDIIAPALASAPALSLLDLSHMSIDPQLARAVGVLTQLRIISVKRSASIRSGRRAASAARHRRGRRR